MQWTEKTRNLVAVCIAFCFVVAVVAVMASATWGAKYAHEADKVYDTACSTISDDRLKLLCLTDETS